MAQTKSKFELLRDKHILTILDGDMDFGSLEIDGIDSGITISMPYLSGPMLCNISNKFGLSVTYSRSGGAQSRWIYLDDLLVHCIKNNNESNLISFLFSKAQFVDKLRGQSPKIIEFAYSHIVSKVITEINSILYFGGNELAKVGTAFVVRKIGTTVTVIAPSVKIIDRSYITSLSERAMKDISEGNYDSAVTKSRTLLEEVFCYVLERKGELPSESGDIRKLYNQVKLLSNMHQNKDMDKRINGLLSGLEKILSAIIEMRNKASDSHGVGVRRINILDHHARLFVNAAMTMADFILAVCEKQTKNNFL